MARLAALGLLLLVTSGLSLGQTGSREGFYVWKAVPNTRQAELYAGGQRVGLWDADENAYYQLDAAGKKTGPVSPPIPIRPHPEQAKYDRILPPVKRGNTDPAKSAEDSDKPWHERMPPWSTYVLGGILTLVITGVGLAMQFRKK